MTATDIITLTFDVSFANIVALTKTLHWIVN